MTKPTKKEWPPRVWFSPWGDPPWCPPAEYVFAYKKQKHENDLEYISVAQANHEKAKAYMEAAAQVDLMKLTPMGRIELIDRLRIWAKQSSAAKDAEIGGE